MKWIILLTFFVLAGCASVPSIQCSTEFKTHVYHPERLRTIQECKTVTGVVAAIKSEPDGDKHIQLRLDSGQEDLLNDRNKSVQKGCLVLEIICTKTPVQEDAIGPCSGFDNTIFIPAKGDHIKVTGSYINDAEGNHGWNEIHPVTKIEMLQ